MKKEVILSQAAPQPIGPYSQAVKIGNLVFVSGTLGIEPATSILILDITGQTRQALENLKAVLSAAGLKLENVAKTTVFLKTWIASLR
jgi:2-iminobutanoate/2-iminopropanoate deaminase